MGGLFSKNKKRVTEQSPLLVGSINFPAGDVGILGSPSDEQADQAIPDDDIENRLTVSHDHQADIDLTLLFNKVLEIIAAQQKKSREANHGFLDLFNHPKDILTLFALNKHSVTLRRQNPALIRHFIERKDTLTQFKFEMYQTLHERRSVVDKVLLRMIYDIGSCGITVHAVLWVLSVGSLLSLGWFGQSYLDDTYTEGLWEEGEVITTIPGHHTDDYVLKNEANNDLIGTVCSAVLLGILIAVYIALLALWLKRNGLIQGNFNSMNVAEIKELESTICNKIDRLTEDEANTPSYREWFTLFVKNKKVGLPVRAYVPDDIKAQPAL